MRHELKYVITPIQYQLLKGRLQAFMKRDSHAGEDGNYFIRSVYFESPGADTLAEKENGVDNRKKYRIRYYENQPKACVLECKSKKGTRISKTTYPLSEEERDLLLAGASPTADICKGSVLEELVVLMKTKGFAPGVVVDYLREAYVYDISNVRITFDKELAGGNVKDCLKRKRYLPNILAPGDMILEVKYDDYLPAHISEILSGVGLTQVAASKFGMCMKKKLEGQIV